MSTDIRLARPGDCSAVEEIVASAYARYIPRIGRKPGPMLDDYPALIEQERVHVLDCDGGVQGLVVLIPEQNAMLLDNVALRPEVQGHGYGKRLIAFAEKVARDAGFRSIRLYTHEKMTENIALYARLGFVETDRAEEKGFQRVYMAKTIAPEAS